MKFQDESGRTFNEEILEDTGTAYGRKEFINRKNFNRENVSPERKLRLTDGITDKMKEERDKVWKE